MEADISLQWLRQQESWREFGCSEGIFKEQDTQFEDDNELLGRFPLGVCTPVGHSEHEPFMMRRHSTRNDLMTG